MSFILTLNLGSSSLKYKLFHSDALKVRSEGIVEEIGKESTCSFKHYNDKDVVKDKHKCNAKDHKEAIHQVLELLTSKSKILSDKSDVKLICHRVVHGGDKLYEPTVLDKEVSSLIPEFHLEGDDGIGCCSQTGSITRSSEYRRDKSSTRIIPKINKTSGYFRYCIPS